MSQISSTSPVDTAIRSGNVNGFSELTSEDFVRIIFTELSHQDPFKPNDTGALLDQLDSIRAIESNIKLESQLQALVTENQLASASNLLGKWISGLDDQFNRVEGFAITALRQNGEIVLEIDTGQQISFDNIETVIDPSLFAPIEDPGDTTGDPGTGEGTTTGGSTPA